MTRHVTRHVTKHVTRHVARHVTRHVTRHVARHVTRHVTRHVQGLLQSRAIAMHIRWSMFPANMDFHLGEDWIRLPVYMLHHPYNTEGTRCSVLYNWWCKTVLDWGLETHLIKPHPPTWCLIVQLTLWNTSCPTGGVIKHTLPTTGKERTWSYSILSILTTTLPTIVIFKSLLVSI